MVSLAAARPAAGLPQTRWSDRTGLIGEMSLGPARRAQLIGTTARSAAAGAMAPSRTWCVALHGLTVAAVTRSKRRRYIVVRRQMGIVRFLVTRAMGPGDGRQVWWP